MLLCQSVPTGVFTLSAFLLHANVQTGARFGMRLRGDFLLKRKIEGIDVLRKIADLAFGRANDAVKLVILDHEREELDSLDLSLLSEVKRGSNGVIEIKLINRLEALELLAKLLGAGEGRTAEAEEFFKALDASAGNMSNV